MAKKRLLTGLQPSGDLHIGNYFGALKPFVDMYKEYESFLMVVDYHALTTLKDPKVLKANILQIAIDYLAVGVDPKEVVLFQQSAVGEHTELAWIFESLVSVPFLMQAHAYKDKVAKGLEANAGLFNYPMLMAADILLYDIETVPVGEDQQQHVEYARKVATKFNNAYGDTFRSPKELVLKGVGVVPGTDGQKMSKSYGNTIPLFGSKDEIAKAVMSIVTDSGGPALEVSSEKHGDSDPHKITWAENVFKIHMLYKNEDELMLFYVQNRDNYKVLKEALIEDIDAYISPMREKRAELEKDKEFVSKALSDGAQKAQTIAAEKMKEVREKIGVSL